jgi:hypothetical protein
MHLPSDYIYPYRCVGGSCSQPGPMGLVCGSGLGRCGSQVTVGLSPDHRSAPLFLNLPFPRQSGTIMSGFVRTLEVIYQVRFGDKKGVAER